MIALFEKLPIILVAAAVVVVAVQILQMASVVVQDGSSYATLLAMIFGLVVQTAQMLALAALVHYAQRIALNTMTGA